MLRKRSPRDKYFKYQNLPTHFRLPLSKIGQIYTPHKFTQSGCIPPKLKCEILAHKGLQTARRLSRLLEPQTNRTTGPPNVTDYGSRFPGKRNPLLTRLFCFFFFISIAKWSVKEDDTMMNKVAKSKEKTRGNNKKKKMQNVLWSKTTNRHTAFKITIRGNCLVYKCFCIKAGTCIKKGKARF